MPELSFNKEITGNQGAVEAQQQAHETSDDSVIHPHEITHGEQSQGGDSYSSSIYKSKEEEAEDLRDARASGRMTKKEQESALRFFETHYSGTVGEDMKHLRKPGGPVYIDLKYGHGESKLDMPSFEEWQKTYLAEQELKVGE